MCSHVYSWGVCYLGWGRRLEVFLASLRTQLEVPVSELLKLVPAQPVAQRQQTAAAGNGRQAVAETNQVTPQLHSPVEGPAMERAKSLRPRARNWRRRVETVCGVDLSRHGHCGRPLTKRAGWFRPRLKHRPVMNAAVSKGLLSKIGGIPTHTYAK